MTRFDNRMPRFMAAALLRPFLAALLAVCPFVAEVAGAAEAALAFSRLARDRGLW